MESSGLVQTSIMPNLVLKSLWDPSDGFNVTKSTQQFSNLLIQTCHQYFWLVGCRHIIIINVKIYIHICLYVYTHIYYYIRAIMCWILWQRCIYIVVIHQIEIYTKLTLVKLFVTRDSWDLGTQVIESVFDLITWNIWSVAL